MYLGSAGQTGQTKLFTYQNAVLLKANRAEVQVALSHLWKKSQMSNKNVIPDESACEEGWNNYFTGTGHNAAWAPGRCIMGRKKGI